MLKILSASNEKIAENAKKLALLGNANSVPSMKSAQIIRRNVSNLNVMLGLNSLNKVNA